MNFNRILNLNLEDYNKKYIVSSVNKYYKVLGMSIELYQKEYKIKSYIIVKLTWLIKK